MDREPERLSPAEQRLIAVLEPLRANAPSRTVDLPGAVGRTARWQAPLRRVLAATGTLAGAFSDVARWLIVGRGGRS